MSGEGADVGCRTKGLNGYEWGSGDGLGRQTWTYDADGNILTWELFGWGVVKMTRTYTYDADGNMLTLEEDWNADGVVEETYTYTYDADGNILTIERAFEGVLYAIDTYTYECD